MTTRRAERNLSDIHSLTEALNRALHDSGLSAQTVAEQLGKRRAYLTDALNEDHEELQFQARMLVPFCRLVGPLPLAWAADQLGYVLVKREQAAEADCIVRETLDVAASAGRLSQRVREAAADGALCLVEQRDIVDEARRVQRDAAEVERAAELAVVETPQTRRVS